MPPSAYSPPNFTASTASRRVVVSPPSGGTTPGVGHPEFEDFMNAYRPTLELTGPKPDKAQSVKDESKSDFGRSLKRLMTIKRGPSPGASTKREGIQRTPLEPRERSVLNELKPPVVALQPKKAARPSSMVLEPGSQHSPSLSRPANQLSASKSDLVPQKSISKPKVEKSSLVSPPDTNQRSPVETAAPMILPAPMRPAESPNSTKRKISGVEPQHQQLSQFLPQQPQPSQFLPIQHSDRDQIKSVQSIKTTSSLPSPLGEGFCLLFTRNHLARFLPPRRTPDVMRSMRIVEIPERKYQIIMQFDEGPKPQVPQIAQSGLQLQPEKPEIWEEKAIWDHINSFNGIRESRIAATGMLLLNVERWTEFPFVTYLVVNGSLNDLYSKVNTLQRGKTPSQCIHEMHFTTAFEETVTMCQPPFPAAPERPGTNKTGYVVSLYQVLHGEDGQRFEQNWGTWTGARHLYCHAPEYMGLKRVSVHKSVLASSIVLYSMVCEFTDLMDHITEACVLVDQIRARCCGFIGVFKVMDCL